MLLPTTLVLANSTRELTVCNKHMHQAKANTNRNSQAQQDKLFIGIETKGHENLNEKKMGCMLQKQAS